MSVISKIEISKLWGKYSLVWDNVNPDVNIIVGINGGGKSTLLKIIRDMIDIHSPSLLKAYRFEGCRLELDNGSVYTCGGEFGKCDIKDEVKVEYINIFEPEIGRLKKNQSILDYQLDRLFYQRDAGLDNFTNYRLKASVGENREDVAKEIDKLFKLINKLFQNTFKKIEISENNVDIQFRDFENNVIPLKYLSSGEKQLLIHLLKVFLSDKKPYIVLFDEPEISLHIEWQQQFIDAMLSLNPNIQIFISTHSPSIFGNGWNDKLFFIEDFIKPTEQK